ncbi:MAG TPA: sialidase family protein [Opitutaceae bacterium]
MKSSVIRSTLLALVCGLGAALTGRAQTPAAPTGAGIEHSIVYQQDGRFAAWPANGGIWMWNNEILVGFVEAKYAEARGLHTYDQKTARHKYARSLDGGKTWAIEDAYDAGQKGVAYDHTIDPDKAVAAKPLDKPMDFTHPEFVLAFARLNNNDDGPSVFYHSTNKGKSWAGPYSFPNLGTAGVATRNDYFIDGKSSLTAIITTAKANKKEGRVASVRTTDGGMNWQFLSYLGEEHAGFDIMPSSERLSGNEIFTTIRTRTGDSLDLMTAHHSKDNGATWTRAKDPVADTGQGGSPPALVRLKDGRLALGYAYRSMYGSRMAVRFSSDNGKSWGNEIPLRVGDGANRDIGYPVMAQRADGKLILIYYWNNAVQPGAKPYRYIAATVFDPSAWK